MEQVSRCVGVGNVSDTATLQTREVSELHRYGKHLLLLLTSSGVPLLLRGKLAPIPLPLGNLKQLGLSSMAAAVATMCISSASSDGAMTTILGKQAMYVISNAPQCVGPSAPTKPALSIANRTGSF